MSSYCALCSKTLAHDCIEIETGNNAEDYVVVDLCEAHLKEAEESESKFNKKYAKQIALELEKKFQED